MSLIITFALLSGRTCFADVVVEPFVGLSQIVFTEVSNTGGGDNVEAWNGFHVGARLGFGFFKKLIFGGEYFQGGPYKDLDNADETTTVRQIGLFVAYDFIGIRLSAAYYPYSRLDEDQGGDEEGKAIRVGMALPIKSKKFLANLDVTIFPSFDTDENARAQNAMVSLSFPLDF